MFDRVTSPLIPLEEGPEVSIEIEGPSGVVIELEDGSVEIGEEGEEGEPEEHLSNLAKFIDDTELRKIGLDIIQNIEDDINSRKEWEDTIKERLPLLGISDVKVSDPWPNSCNLIHPMLAEAVIRFQSNAIMEIFPASGPVKAEIIGEVTDERMAQAERESGYMNFLLTEKMEDYRTETEKLLFGLAVYGSSFRKGYYDEVYQRECAKYVPANDFILPYSASSLQSASRYAERMRLPKNEIRKLQVAGVYRDIEIEDSPDNGDDLTEAVDKIKQQSPSSTTVDSDDVLLYEAHCDIDLPAFNGDDGIARPYIVTVDDKGNVYSIYRNWKEDDPTKRKILWFAQYNFIIGMGAYGLGLLHLIGGSSKAATSIQRQLINAGILANLPGGFKTKGLRVKGDDSPHRPGEWRDVDVSQGKIADNFFPLPYKEPSNTLLQLLSVIVDDGRRLGSIADAEIGDVNSQAPVGTTYAMMERAMKVLSAIQARCHASMKDEFRILARVIKDHLSEDGYPYDVYGASRQVMASDFDGRIDVIPVSDPNAATMAQRMTLYQMAIQLSQTAPQLYDLGALHRQMLRSSGIKDVNLIIPDKDDVKPADAVVENMAIVTGKPVKAFEWQDHQAHITSHMSFVQDPQTAQILGQNPQAQGIFAAAMAHIAEHLAYLYRTQIEMELGFPLPDLDKPLPGDIESRLSLMVAEASQRLQGKHQNEAAQKQAQQQAQDPVIQMQQTELQIKAQKVQTDSAIAQRKLELEAARLASTKEVELTRIATQKEMAAEAAIDRGEQFLAEAKLNAPKQSAEIQKIKAQIAELLARVDQMQDGGMA